MLQKKYIERFIKEISRNAEEATCIGYESDIRLFLEDISKKKSIEDEEELLKSISNDDVEDWIEFREKNENSKEKYSLNTLNRKIISINLFFTYLKENKGLISRNPFNNVSIFDPNKIEKKQKDILTLEEVKKMIAETYIKKSTDRCFYFNSARIRFIIALMVTTGLRISEVLNISLQDIEAVSDGYMININKEKVKNDMDKRVPITGIVVEYYNEYLEERTKLKKIIDKDVLILSSRGKSIDRKITERDIKKYLDRVGIDKEINNHSYRHIFRTSLTKKNINESLICIIGGWSRKNLSMSAIYTHDTKDLDKEKMEACNIL